MLMGQATAPRVQALISNDDDAWIKKNKPKGMTTSKFVASLVAEAIVERERRRKIGAGTGDAIHNRVIECASCLEELQNLCQYFNRKLKDDIKHHLDGTQFEDQLLYNAFVLDSSAPAAPTPTEAPKDIKGAIEAAKKKGFTHQVVAKNVEPLPKSLEEHLRVNAEKAGIKDEVVEVLVGQGANPSTPLRSMTKQEIIDELEDWDRPVSTEEQIKLSKVQLMQELMEQIKSL
jgi:hypothetical protein